MPVRCLVLLAAFGASVLLCDRALGQAKVNPKLPKVNPKGKDPNAPKKWDWEQFVKETSVLPPEEQVSTVLKKMREVNPGFREFHFARIERGAVTRVALDTYEVDDIAPIRAFDQLRELHAVGNTGAGKLEDVTPLKGLKLEFLDLSYNRKLSEISIVKDMPLQTFRCDYTAVETLAPLQNIETLEVIQSNYNKVTSLAPLKGLKLKTLQVSKQINAMGQTITDLTPLKGMMLTVFHADNIGAKDYAVLAPMPVMDLSLAGTPIANFTILKEMPLKTVNLSRTTFNDTHGQLLKGKPVESLTISQTPIRDLGFVKDLPLTSLDCSFCAQLRDLAPLKDMKIATLNVANTQIKDLKPLAGMPLKTLYCADTNVASVEPLKGGILTFLDIGWRTRQGVSALADLSPLQGVPLQTLYCQNSQVKDLKGLSGSPIMYLYCSNTPIRDLKPLAGTPLVYLSCKNTKVSDFSVLKDAERLATLDCDAKLPKDKAALQQIKSLRVFNGQNAQNLLN